MTCSNWKITWDLAGTPVVYLAHDQEMAREISLPLEQVHEERLPVESTHTDYLPRNWVKGTLEFTAITDHASDAAAREAFLATMAALPWGLSKTITIEVKNGDSYTLASCMIKSATPEMIEDPELARMGITYKFLCGALAVVP